MQMHEQTVIVDGQEQPLSRTYQYRKVNIRSRSLVEVTIKVIDTVDRRSFDDGHETPKILPVSANRLHFLFNFPFAKVPSLLPRDANGGLFLGPISFSFSASVNYSDPLLLRLQVTKPMLERKRRARINRCLDELKDLMVTALASDGENVAKLEKADILELTVRHLHKLQRQQRLSANPVIDADRFRAGYTHCANEVSRCLATTPGVDVVLGTKLMTYLAHKLNSMDKTGPLTIHVAAPQRPPSSSSACSSELSSEEYSMPLTPASSQPSPVRTTDIDAVTRKSPANHQGLLQVVKPSEAVWRPW